MKWSDRNEAGGANPMDALQVLSSTDTEARSRSGIVFSYPHSEEPTFALHAKAQLSFTLIYTDATCKAIY
jgi:hypothetical protein